MPEAERQTVQQVRRDRVPVRHGSPLPSTGVRAAAPVPELLLQMQRTAGNTAVTAFLQRYAARLAPPEPPARRGEAPPAIQRLVTSAQMVELAGPVSKKAQANKSSYVQILGRLDAYHLAKEPEKKTAILTEIVALCEQWMAHNKPKEGSKDTRSAKDKRKSIFIEGLHEDARDELAGNEPSDDPKRPSALIATRTQLEGSPGAPDYKSPSATSASNRKAPDRWVFTIAAWKQNPDLLKLHAARTASVMRNKARNFALNNPVNRKIPLFAEVEPKSAVAEGSKPRTLRRGLIPLAQVKDSKGTAEKAARKVVEQREGSGELTPDQRAYEIRWLSLSTDEVGHTWVKLSTYARDELLSVTSFGFWPLGGFGAPNKPVPGVVRHPDTEHEHDDNVLFADYEVTALQYAQALAHATKMQGAHPDYTAAGYNCTLFAKETMEAAQLAFPGTAYKTMGVIKTFNPNNLHESLEKIRGKKGAPNVYNPKDADAERREEEERRVRASYPLAHVLRRTSFFLGENFNEPANLLYIGPDDVGAELRNPGQPIVQGEHPIEDQNGEQAWILLLRVDLNTQVETKGWVKLADVDARGGSPTMPSAAPSRPRGASGEGSSSGGNGTPGEGRPRRQDALLVPPDLTSGGAGLTDAPRLSLPSPAPQPNLTAPSADSSSSTTTTHPAPHTTAPMAPQEYTIPKWVLKELMRGMTLSRIVEFYIESKENLAKLSEEQLDELQAKFDALEHGPEGTSFVPIHEQMRELLAG